MKLLAFINPFPDKLNILGGIRLLFNSPSYNRSKAVCKWVVRIIERLRNSPKLLTKGKKRYGKRQHNDSRKKSEGMVTQIRPCSAYFERLDGIRQR
jgi:hypothetical protein